MPQPPLFIIPSSITETFYSGHHSEAAREAMRQATILFVENLKPARRFVKALLPNAVIDNYQWIAFDKHSERYSVEEVQQAFGLKQPMALLSDAGYPSIGDPGFALVQMAHQAQVDLHPLPGACSFLMALSASGLNGQQFAFHGYLPHAKPERIKFLNEAETTSKRTGATQIVMDTPYRNQSTFLDLLNNLMPSTRLCIALGILEPGQFIQTKSIHTWCTQVPVLARVPAVFLFQA